MEFVQRDKILQIRPDTIQSIHKMYNLDKPGSLKEAIRILNEWIQKQPHFNKKDFADHFLEISIILNKGSIERAKSQLDKMCTMRTLMPDFFGKFNCKTDFEHLYEVVLAVVLPKITEDQYRIFVNKYFDIDWEPSQAIYFYRHVVIMTEYIKAHDYLGGSILILDFSEANVMSFLKKSSPVTIRQAMILIIVTNNFYKEDDLVSLIFSGLKQLVCEEDHISEMLKAIHLCDDLPGAVEGYAMRMKAIHIISESNFVDGLVTLLKQVVSAKIASRIHVHKSVKDLHEFFPKAILPEDYGGEERSLKTLQEEWIDVLSSEEHLSYIEEINKATTNESCRPKDQLLEQYGGMPGTFRFLSVD